jgi:hypothetical protein
MIGLRVLRDFSGERRPQGGLPAPPLDPPETLGSWLALVKHSHGGPALLKC